MDNQSTLNAIATLAGAIDPLIRAKKEEAVVDVVAKLLELVKKL
jgi:hypothetical protein